MLTVKKYKSIHEIDAQHWDSILNPGDIFHTHNFISIVEDSKVENADFFYLLFYKSEKLAATAVLSAFNISLDLFISNGRLIKKIKKHFPNLFTIKILVCGLPASFGQQNLKIADYSYVNEVCSLLTREMRLIAKELRIKFMAIKEFLEKDINIFRSFDHQGFFSANSIPYMNMDLPWNNFNEYLSSIRHHYRRKIRLSLRKVGHSKPVIISQDDYNADSDKPAFVLTHPDEKFADEFYRMYLKVMERTPTKLETLNKAFFEILFHQKENCKLLNLLVKGKVISSGVLIFYKDTLTFMLVARENEKDKYDSYFNLIYGIIALAIETGCKKIKLGQTAYWVKQCVGGEPEKEYIWFASTSKFWHWMLRKANKLVFPETKLKHVQVFKENKKEGKIAVMKKEVMDIVK